MSAEGGATQRDARGTSCFSFRGHSIEERLASWFWKSSNRQESQPPPQAAERLAALHAQERQLILDRLEASREVEARAAREYKKTDVTYTAVRRRLAQEWEQALLAVQKEEDQLSRFDESQTGLPTAAQQQALKELGQNVRRILVSSPGQLGSQKADRADFD